MKAESRTIVQATDECRKAWKDNPSQYGWCIHHEIEFEELSKPIENRIGYILSNKSKHEQVTRLDNMRPVSTASLKIVLSARKAYDEAIASASKAYDEAIAPASKAYDEAIAPAWKAYNEAKASAWKAYNEADASAWKAYDEAIASASEAYDEAIASARKAYDESIAPAHRADVPNHTWNGKSIFGEEQ
jgi:tetratricopeptide (TPR) repeat protein